MRIGFLLPSIYMHIKFGKGRIFAPGKLGSTLVNGLVKNGHEVFFYTAPDVSTKAHLIKGDKDLLSQSWRYFLFRNRSEEEQRFTIAEIQKRDYEYQLTVKAYQDAKEGKLDIIHSYHDFGAHYFHELTNFSTVYTLHDPMPPEDSLEFHRLNEFSHHPFISISDSQRSKFPINFVETIYHGIPVEDYELADGSGGYLIHFGRLLADKGAHLAIQVAKEVKIPLHIATSKVRANTSQEYYEEKIKPHIDGVNVKEIGYLETKGLSDYIGGGIAFLFPLQWEEPFGMVLIESMACGTPVIAYNRGSVSEIVKDGVTGFIIDPDDDDRPGKGTWVIKKKGIEGLVEAVKRIGEIDRKVCREHVERNFSVEKMVEGYERIYKRLSKTNI